MTPPSTAPAQIEATQGTSANPEPQTYNEKLNAADRLWKFKIALTVILIIMGLIGIGCIAWAVSTANEFRSGYDYGYDSTWSLPWGLITLSISVIWCVLCVALFLTRKRPVHPGVRVTMDLLLWLGFLVTALFTMVALVNLLQWGEYGTLGYDSGWDSRYGFYVLQPNNTWTWEQDSSSSSSSSITYPRTCNSTTSSTSSYTSYYTSNPFTSCAEMDAYVNALWHAKPARARIELTGVVCQFLGLVLHFALFVWACVDCHKHRRAKVSQDAEKIAAGIVEKIVRTGAVMGNSGPQSGTWHALYYQLPDGAGHGVSPLPPQQGVQSVQGVQGQGSDGPGSVAAGPSSEKRVAEYYAPGQMSGPERLPGKWQRPPLT
ncbi:hypothetical protein EJ07DRAFT_140269 [Lizonia empirigonia]|nr:hypothetical protein EJ07DRAFT_140269 [Lizonia empirigonia]